MIFADFSGYVLAGGKSSRMQTDKAFLKSDGDEIFLERAANALKFSVQKVKVVINENQREKFELAFPSFDFVFDIHASRGALGGIHAALKDCETKWAIILAVDLPFIRSDTISDLARITGNSGEVFAIVPRQQDDRTQPLCAAYRAKNCLPIIEKLLSEEISVSMRDFLQLVPVKFVETGELTNNREDLFFNVNRPSDFETLNRSLSAIQ
jgi:molybdenum cofactor guanylyltransferase